MPPNRTVKRPAAAPLVAQLYDCLVRLRACATRFDVNPSNTVNYAQEIRSELAEIRDDAIALRRILGVVRQTEIRVSTMPNAREGGGLPRQILVYWARGAQFMGIFYEMRPLVTLLTEDNAKMSSENRRMLLDCVRALVECLMEILSGELLVLSTRAHRTR